MSIAFPGEPADYRAARDRLLEQEIELRRVTEAVAAARRALPPGGPVTEDYVFEGTGAGGAQTNVKLSELFEPGKNSLAIYNFIFPRDPGDTSPGPAIGKTALLSLAESPCHIMYRVAGPARRCRRARHTAHQLRCSPKNVAPTPTHLRRRARLAAPASPVPAGNTYNRDYHRETADGIQRPMLNVFHHDSDTTRHFWGSELLYAPTDGDQEPRHVGTLEPLWNLFDLTPEGRPNNWWEQLTY